MNLFLRRVVHAETHFPGVQTYKYHVYFFGGAIKVETHFPARCRYINLLFRRGCKKSRKKTVFGAA